MVIPIVVPLLTLGAARYLARHRESSRLLARAPSSATEPSPLTVIDAFLSLGETPPPAVVFGAIAHAESLGWTELADEIVRVFVLPSVLQVERETRRAAGGRAAGAAAATYPVGGGGLPPMTAAPAHASTTTTPARPPSAVVTPATWSSTSSAAPAASASSPAMPDAAPPGEYSAVVGGDAIDPEAQRVLEELAHAGSRAAKVELLSGPAAAPEPDAEAQRVLEELAHTGSRAAKVELLPGLGAAVERDTSSPIDGVAAHAWLAFVGRVSREPPTFAAARHVGQFRQRRERLLELGIDPTTVIGSPEAQLAALDADMRDAYLHARGSGLVDEYLGTELKVSAGGTARPTEVTLTLSGVLGVIQAAGLEGAVQWLEQPDDRTRFPHTTQAFLRCNGVF